MIAALALAAAVVAPDLSAAQAAFAQGDYERADALATAAAQPPREGAALYLAGLARFRAGRAEEALDALDRAEHASDPPAPGLFHYNRAACFYELGRFADAEADYLKAAEIDPSIATLSLVNASYAALDGGSAERAREIAGRARAAAKPGEADLIADLATHIGASGVERATAEYREGLADYDDGRFAEAREHFHRATELDPADGRSLIMSGASSYRLGERGRARADLNEALRRRLDDEDTRTARDYIDALRGGLPSRKTWEGAVRLAAGFDNDPLQTGFFESNEIPRFSTVENASGVATADVVVAVRPRLREGLGTELAYAFNQIAYLTDPASDLSLQQHELATALEWAVRDTLRVGVAGLGQMTFTGVSRFRGLQNAIGASTWGSYDEGDWTSTRVDLGWTGKQGVGAEFAYLTGSRADVAATQQLHVRSFSMDLGYRFRAEMIGPPQPSCPPDARPRGALRLPRPRLLGLDPLHGRVRHLRGQRRLRGARLSRRQLLRLGNRRADLEPSQAPRRSILRRLRRLDAAHPQSRAVLALRPPRQSLEQRRQQLGAGQVVRPGRPQLRSPRDAARNDRHLVASCSRIQSAIAGRYLYGMLLQTWFPSGYMSSVALGASRAIRSACSGGKSRSFAPCTTRSGQVTLSRTPRSVSVFAFSNASASSRDFV
jgi:Flp pilus assembly protein TadD